MGFIQIVFLLGLLTPGLIRGFFWADSPSRDGIVWVFVTIAVAFISGWIVAIIIGSGSPASVVMTVTIIAANWLAYAGSTLKKPKTTS